MSVRKNEQNRQLLYKIPPRKNLSRRVSGALTKATLMLGVFLVGFMVVIVGLWELTRQTDYIVHVLVHTDQLVHKTDPRFLSLALDTSLIQDGWVHESIWSGRLLKLAALLSPAYLRVGGTLADRLMFQPVGECTPGQQVVNLSCSFEARGCSSQNISVFNMSGADWLAINRFASAAGLHLVFDLNVLLRNGLHWDSSNARQLLDFSNRHGFNISWQLGNEPNTLYHVFGEALSARQLAADYVSLRQLLDSYRRYRSSLLLGPEVTRPKHKMLADEPLQYLREFLAHAGVDISVVTWHQYYLNSRKAKLQDFVRPGVLNVLACQISEMQAAASGVQLPMWLSETGSVFGGGTAGLSDRYVAGFLWLDKLGMAARLGVDVVVRQSLYGNNYGLLDQQLDPLPDWWVSLLYKRLVGPGVLDVEGDDIFNTSCAGQRGHVRLYCHCAREPASVVLFGSNLLKQASHVVVSGLPTADGIDAYVLTADVILKSRDILLNGKRLHLNPDGSTPSLEPQHLNTSLPLVMPAFSMVFWVFSNVHTAAC